MEGYVWYASYGSNISTNRFLCYINGGQAFGATTSDEGCKDNSLPIKYENIVISKKQYFTKNSIRWQNKGVAFLDHKTSDAETLGRMYLITKSQFEDVVKQENHMKVNDFLDCKLDEARINQYTIIIKNSWYGGILFLGERDGYPIYTFTNVNDINEEELSFPSHEYIQMIGSGIKENYKMDLNSLADYFIKIDGISYHYNLDDIKNILSVLFKEI